MSTVREKLAERYPLHFQRIVECTAQYWPENDLSIMLAGPASESVLGSCFVWEMTEEGHDYWMALSNMENDYAR